LDIGLSIGAATLNSGEDASAVLAQADTRMYEAKASEETPVGT
jgi:PleD family two-component response regulator